MARGVVLTFLLNNYVDQDQVQPALEWESLFVAYLKNFTSDQLEFAYMAERSIEDGIQEISQAESVTVLISYGVMFLYIILAMGRLRSLRTLFVNIYIYTSVKKLLLIFIIFYFQPKLESKITLAIGGIAIVLSSVFCSLGFFGYLGIQTTMLTIEVNIIIF